MWKPIYLFSKEEKLMINDGVITEDEFIYYLNDKYPSELSENLQNLLKVCFGIVDPNKKVFARKPDNLYKTDIILTHRDVEVGVSIKSGTARDVHTERLSTFLDFLRKYNISENAINIIKKFAYGDGTLDGTGTNKMVSEQVYEWLKDEIPLANKELNASRTFLYDFVERCMFTGVYTTSFIADVIVYGTAKNCIAINRNQVFRHIKRNFGQQDFYNALHIGQFILRPHTRNPKYREISMVVYLPKLKDEFMYISKRYNSYISPIIIKKNGASLRELCEGHLKVTKIPEIDNSTSELLADEKSRGSN